MTFYNLAQYIEEQNFWRRIMKQPELHLNSITQDELLVLVDKVENDLSPENLTGDGELSRAHVQKKYQYLVKVQAELRNKIGSITK